MAGFRMVPLPHNRLECDGGWSATTDTDVSDRLQRVMLLCWTCGARVDLSALTPATDDPGGHGYGRRDELERSWVADRVPAEHTPRLAVSTSGTWSLPASVPSLRVGPVLVHVERWLHNSPDLAYEWIVTTPAGDFLGAVMRYSSNRGAIRFRWGTVEDVGGHGEGETSLRAAARRIAAVALASSDAPLDLSAQ